MFRPSTLRKVIANISKLNVLNLHPQFATRLASSSLNHYFNHHDHNSNHQLFLLNSASSCLFSVTQRNIFIRSSETPNPASMKFFPEFKVLDEKEYPDISSLEISNPLQAYVSPLAKLLFKIDGVKGVFLSRDFVTVTIDDPSMWSHVKLEVFSTLNNFFENGGTVLNREAKPNEDTMIQEGDDEVIIAIKEILETRIRPMVQEDGGDIVFSRFDDETGTVYVKLQGSCASCPSSTETLKNGIENMLMHYVAEVERVEQELDPMEAISEEQLKKTEERITKEKSIVDQYTA
ncbi:hypothetical protein FDP41_001852 [Naegleria fowleri]|uniref:Scaffold protein Nfu/NifU N-terminal domain-containing protein n=1 Tax=Naegleria fowleri TaxID=5763 RepID=A0A6A5BVY0_NAEFO|nr:uncharacterized protein FDP41_001852 [Naegleria fowleri]KAF0978782.1 hypothetical protein FDP41_001852 [Naegleria fowleri]CAG4716376.1 unnamed protein product [Naegleria fowleri]